MISKLVSRLITSKTAGKLNKNILIRFYTKIHHWYKVVTPAQQNATINFDSDQFRIYFSWLKKKQERYTRMSDQKKG
jgi:hypothetical protein